MFLTNKIWHMLFLDRVFSGITAHNIETVVRNWYINHFYIKSQIRRTFIIKGLLTWPWYQRSNQVKSKTFLIRNTISCKKIKNLTKHTSWLSTGNFSYKLAIQVAKTAVEISSSFSHFYSLLMNSLKGEVNFQSI